MQPKQKIELLSPAGSMANLKAAVSRGADAVYLGMRRFSARDFAVNFNEPYLKEAIKICASNNVKSYLAMNTLVKNHEIKQFFSQLSYAYSKGIDAVIIQEISFLDIIRENYPDLKIHLSTQAGVMNSANANLFQKADRITLARELTENEIRTIRNSFQKELEIFCHGALCVSISGSCLFSSLLGGRSGNRGRCAQPCRKKYDNQYFLSLKELCLIEKIPDIINIGIDAIKIEGRMRTPYYAATTTDIYRKAIDSFYKGNFEVTKEMKKKLYDAFSREFTSGWFEGSKDMFNKKAAAGESSPFNIKEMYNVRVDEIEKERKRIEVKIAPADNIKSKEKRILARVYSKKDAIDAYSNGADIIYFDLFSKDFAEIKDSVKCKVFAVTPRIMLDSDIQPITHKLNENKPDGILAGNLGILNLKLNLPIHLDYNINCFNDIGIGYYSKQGVFPIISPELSISELSQLKNKNFGVFVHGKIRLMTLRHELAEGYITDEKGAKFWVNKIRNGSEILNGKELGLLSRTSNLLDSGITNLFIDTDKNIPEIVRFYRDILDGKRVDDSKIKKSYVLGWSYQGVI